MNLTPNHHKKILTQAIESIEQQANTLLELPKYLKTNFISVIQLLHQCKGRVIVSGIGKSAIIAQKIVATFNSTGTPSLYMHAADAIHGDLGMVQAKDIVIVISKSGESPEIKVLIPLLKNLNAKVVGICSNEKSFLAQKSDIYLHSFVKKEACPNNLAPTTSTTVQMVIGDALAICLMNLNNFQAKDFAKYHPGGSLGKKLYLTVSDLIQIDKAPWVDENAPLKDVILMMTSKRLGATIVGNKSKQVLGIITDGDLRRMLNNPKFNMQKITAKEIYTKNPMGIDASELAVNAWELMKQKNINQLLVTNKKKYLGLLHIQDLVKEGIL